MNKTPIGKVACKGCKACCEGGLVGLHPEDGDDVSSYVTRKYTREDGVDAFALEIKNNGSCVYLGKSGCTIHNRRPIVCRTFDCRLLYWRLRLQFSRSDLRAQVSTGDLNGKIIRAGKDRKNSLDATPTERMDAKVYWSINTEKAK